MAMLRIIRVGAQVYVVGGGASARIACPAWPAEIDYEQARPSLPGTWTSNTTGYYYVKQGGANAGNGYPSSPRGSMPTGVPAGSVIVFDNTASLSLTSFQWSPSGSAGNKVWLVSSHKYGLGSGDTRAIVEFTSSGELWGEYLALDGIDFYSNTTNQSGMVFGGYSNRIRYLMARDCRFRGNGQFRAANSGNSLGGIDTSTRSEFWLFQGCDYYDMGQWNPSTPMAADTDVLGLQITDWTQDGWLLDCNFYHCQSDGMQVTPSNPSTIPYDASRRITFNGCSTYENLQGGFWNKIGDDYVYSQNRAYNLHRSVNANENTANSHCMGGQYSLGRMWYLFNHCWNADNGFRYASSNPPMDSPFEGHWIGNIIHDITSDVNVIPASANSEGSCFSVWQQGTGLYHRVLHNTCWRYNGHGFAATNAAGDDLQFSGNIFNGRLNSSCYDLFLERAGVTPIVKNNIFPASPRLSVDSALTTSIASFQSADATNRSGNYAEDVTFVNAAEDAEGNFRISSSINAAGNGAFSEDDYAAFETAFGFSARYDHGGAVRPQGGTYDIGAYETT